MSIRAKIISGYVVALAMLVAVGTVAFVNVTRLIDTATWTAHTHEVLEAANRLEADLNFAETGARGYVISGDPFYLSEFSDQVTKARAELARIKDLTLAGLSLLGLRDCLFWYSRAWKESDSARTFTASTCCLRSTTSRAVIWPRSWVAAMTP